MNWGSQPLPALSFERVAVQWLDMDQVEANPQTFAPLSQDEVTRAQKFVTTRLSTHYRIAHSYLRERLADKTGLSPAAIHYTTNDWGKPALPDGYCQFNLSHSDNLALLGIGHDAPIGVDIEKYRNFDAAELRSLAKTIMTAAEQSELDRLLSARTSIAETIASHAFLTAWTRKEACVKALGLGLSFGVENLHVGLTQRTKQIDIPPDHSSGRTQTRMTLISHQIGTTAICALAVVAPDRADSVDFEGAIDFDRRAGR